MDPRLVTVETLLKVVRDQQSLPTATTLTVAQVSVENRPLYRQMCYGLLRHYWSLKKIAALLLAKPLPAKHADIELLIMLGLYQIQFLGIPDHASVSRTVEVASALGKNWAKGLVNGVLRRFIRDRSSLFLQLQEDPEFRYAHPGWLISMIQQAWPVQYERILQDNNLQAPLTLRVNQRVIDRDAFDPFPGPPRR